MLASQKFKSIENNLSKILYMVQTNPNFLRYMKYLDNDPLNPDKPDINLEEVEGQFFDELFDGNTQETKQVLVFFSEQSGNLKSQPLGSDMYVMEFVIPKEFNTLQGFGKKRCTRLAFEVSTRIDGKNIAGIGQVEIVKYNKFNIGTDYVGYTLWIEVSTPTIKS